MKILVVEDDSKTANTMMEVLESEGYAVFSASNKATAVELVQKVSPSLIFLSAIYTDASGLEVARTIREMDGMEGIPFVMLTEMEEEYSSR